MSLPNPLLCATQIIAEPICLEEVLVKVDDGAYLCASDFDADLNLLVRNAEEYNPSNNARSRQIISAARDMRDKAHSMLHNFRKRIGYDMLEQCAAIARRRRGDGEGGEAEEGAQHSEEPASGGGGDAADDADATAGGASGAAAATGKSAAEGAESAEQVPAQGSGAAPAPPAGPVLGMDKAADTVGEVARLCGDMASRLRGRSVGECSAVYHALLRLASATAGDGGVATAEAADLLVLRLGAFVRALGRA